MVRKHTRKLRRVRRRTHRRGGGAWWNPFSKKSPTFEVTTYKRTNMGNKGPSALNGTRYILTNNPLIPSKSPRTSGVSNNGRPSLSGNKNGPIILPPSRRESNLNPTSAFGVDEPCEELKAAYEAKCGK